jgi:cytochrome c biogenesis protein CcdA/DsbC/DsbD-like thiol-disulfide interchange protein
VRGATLFRRIVLLAASVLAAGSSVAQEITAPAPATLEALLESDGVRPGSSVRAVLEVTLPDRRGLHTNSNKPRDPNLIPTELTIEAPAGITVDEIVYPEAIDLKQEGADQPLAVYEREFSIGVVLSLAASAPVGEIKIPATLRYQACDEKQCYFPKNLPAEWTLRVVGGNAALKPVNTEAFAGIAFGRGQKPGQPAPDAKPAASLANASSEELARDGVARLANFDVAGMTVGYLGSADFLQFIRDAEAGVVQKGMFEGRGPLAILLIVFLGGLALNLTPCVLPMIPINLAIIGAGSQAGSRSRGFLLGSVYGAAMAFVYGVLGLIVVLTAGTFGTINSSPWFNFAIAAVFVVLALAMFDVIVIDFSSLGSRFRVSEQGRGTVVVAFSMGAIAALLAGACVAPVVVQVVLLSSNLYAAGTTAALALPFVLGVGMAVPWPIAGAGIGALPRPGAWMVRIKQVFGAVILATALYYGYESYLLFSNRWVDASEVSASVEEKLRAGWQPVLAEGLAKASAEGKPVLIDLWATWCKNCLVMDQTTLANSEVTSALSGYVKIKLQAEDLDQTPAREVLRRVNSSGLPTYVILKPKQ